MKKAASATTSSTIKQVTSRNNSSIDSSKALANGSEILKQAKNKYYLKREHLNLAPAQPKVVVAESKHIQKLPTDTKLKRATDQKLQESVSILPPKTSDKAYTLVLDLDETLVHFVTAEKKFKLRPGCLWFLKEMSLCFELIVFTAAAKDYADFILDVIERRAECVNMANEPNSNTSYSGKKLFAHRLYRPQCQLDGGVYVKDLSRLGRSLSKILIVDNIRDNFER